MKLKTFFRAPLPGQVIFGSGRVAELAEICEWFGRRALLVIGGGSLERSGGLARVEEALRSGGVEWDVLAGVPAEPPVECVDEGRQKLHALGAQMVIGVGGGSVLDVAKAIAALAHEEAPCVAFHRGEVKVTQRGLPCIALPTTAGTGSEATPNAVLTDRERRVKASLRGGDLMPAVALVDPQLTLSCPPAVTAHAGLDAISQALESWVSVGANPLSDMLALDALRWMAPALQRAVSEGSDLSAREAMALGSLFAGMALASARLGLVHGIAHPIGELYHLPHGLVCGLLMPSVMEFNMPVAGGKYAVAARALSLAEPGTDDQQAAEALIAWFRSLLCKLGVGRPLGEYGLSPADFDFIIEQGLPAGSTRHNPRQPTADDLRAFLQKLIEAY
ncbi:MAG: iron-containing alcohol dehydrogenase [Armatimonadetes bacterium]|nr:iron-containing alcohol dehydrogenase [Armatimonadota bacterium]